MEKSEIFIAFGAGTSSLINFTSIYLLLPLLGFEWLFILASLLIVIPTILSRLFWDDENWHPCFWATALSSYYFGIAYSGILAVNNRENLMCIMWMLITIAYIVSMGIHLTTTNTNT